MDGVKSILCSKMSRISGVSQVLHRYYDLRTPLNFSRVICTFEFKLGLGIGDNKYIEYPLLATLKNCGLPKFCIVLSKSCLLRCLLITICLLKPFRRGNTLNTVRDLGKAIFAGSLHSVQIFKVNFK